MSFFKRLASRFTKNAEEEDKQATYKEGMKKTRGSFTNKINDLMARYRQVDEEFFEELEEALIMSDVGVNVVMDLVEELKFEAKRRNIQDTEEVVDVISEKLVDIYYRDEDESIEEMNLQEDELTVILVVGVNGVGKTTSIGKLASQYKQEGKKVVLAAGDTFRAGAIEQLDEWGKEAEVEVVKA